MGKGNRVKSTTDSQNIKVRSFQDIHRINKNRFGTWNIVTLWHDMRTQALDQGPSTFYQKLEMTKILEFYFGKIFVNHQIYETVI